MVAQTNASVVDPYMKGAVLQGAHPMPYAPRGSQFQLALILELTTDTRPTERDHCPMETGRLVVLLPTAEGRGEYVVTAYTVFADGRLHLHMADGSPVTFELDNWTDVR